MTRRADGSIVLLGQIRGSAHFGEGENTTTLSLEDDPGPYSDTLIFIALYDTNGTLEWARKATSSEAAYAGAVVASGDGFFIFTGTTFAASFGEGAKATQLGWVQNMFLAKYDGEGSLLWGTNAEDHCSDFCK